MGETETRLWHDFQALAIRHPDCEAIKVVKNMQRAFIAHQQAQIARELLAAVLNACRAAPSTTADPATTQVPGPMREGTSTA